MFAGNNQYPGQVQFNPTQNNQHPAMAQISQMINPQNPPPVQVNCHPNLQQSLGFVCGALIDQIQQRAGQNPARMFMFNLLADRNYQNSDFVILVSTTMEMILMRMATSNGAVLNNVISQCVGELVNLWLGYVIPKNMQIMQSVMTPQMSQDVNRMNQDLQALQGMVQSFKNQASMASMPGQSQVMQGYNNGGFNNNQQRPVNNGGFAGWSNPSNNNQGGNNTSMAGRFDTGSNNANVVQENIAAMKNTVKPAPEPVAPVVDAVIPNAHWNSSDWTPSVDQPHTKAFNPAKKFSVIDDNVNGNLIQTLMDKKMFNEEEHKLPGIVQTSIIKFEPYAEMQKESLNVVTAFIAEHNKIEDDNVPPTKHTVLPAWIIETAYENFSFNLSARAVFDYTDAVAVIGKGIIGRMFTRESNEAGFLAALNAQNTFHDLLDVFENYASTINPKLWVYCHNLITKKINSILVDNLGIEQSVESFVGDYNDLLHWIDDNYGERTTLLFTSNAGGVIRSLFIHQEEDVVSNLNAMLYSADDAEKFDEYSERTVWATEHIIQATLTIPSNAIGLELENSYAALVEADECLFVHTLIKSMFDNAKKEDEFFTHFYIETSDGLLLEAFRGWQVQGSFLIKVVK